MGSMIKQAGTTPKRENNQDAAEHAAHRARRKARLGSKKKKK